MSPPSAQAAIPQRDVYTVSRLNREVKLLLESGLPAIWIEGEISNLSRPASGHIYFSLRDAGAQVRCALFRGNRRLLGFEPRDGQHVLARARVSLYEERGDYQLVVEYLEEAGEGRLRRAFEQLKQRLAKEGLFDPARKKPLPRLPKRLGLITSPTGAVLHDILTTLGRRFPAIAVRLYPVPVQGEGAAERIAAAIRLAGRQKDCDALILARGGGSLEDLWAFNEEIVARALHACPIAVVSGIGHETDFTIADFVADARAPTPTAAAEMLSPNWGDWHAEYRDLEQRLTRLLRGRLQRHAQHLDWLGARLVHPQQRVELLRGRLHALALRLRHAHTTRLRETHNRLTELAARLHRRSPRPRLQEQALHLRHTRHRLHAAMHRRIERLGQRLAQVAHTLGALSPLATLERGYAIVRHVEGGAVLRAARAARPGERVTAQLARGALDCLVERVRDTWDGKRGTRAKE